MQRRHAMAQQASETTDLDQRAKLLQSMPDCSQPESALPPLAPPAPPPAPCGQGQRLVEGACTDAPAPRGFTSEVSIGLAWTSPGLSGDPNSSLVHGVAGLNVGLGGFLTPNVAMTVRVSGVTWLDSALVYFGVIGPNVQAWFGRGFVGGGIGVGFFAGCGSGSCDSTTTTGFDLRAGYRFGENGTVSVETQSIHGFFSQDSLQTVSFLIGYQSF
jgi:hypothetical protein